LSEEKILALKEVYDQDYEDVKKVLGVPSGVSFGLKVIFDREDKIILGRAIPISVEVFAKQSREEVLRSNGDMAFADVVVSVW